MPANLTRLFSHFENGTFRLHVYHGDQRDRDVGRISSYEIILTTYDTLVADLANKKTGCLCKVAWRRVMLDEGACWVIVNVELLMDVLTSHLI
jgi:SNF2 family DNA or RNA helicase